MKGRSLLDNWLISTAILVSLLSGVFVLWLYLPSYLNSHLRTLSDKGVYGDSYGSVNALFTGLAFAGLVFTIFLQQREIKLQRDDFFSQLEEMKLSREEVGRQVKTQEKQLMLGIADLKMKALDVKNRQIEMQSLQWMESVRHSYAGPELEKVKIEMIDILAQLEDDLKS